MSSRASVELWQTILKFSISVPLFFDPDPLETYGVEAIPHYFYENAYWESERTRNTLRRVCHAWNSFLRSYDHRFVRFIDVLHGSIPLAALSSAIRVDLGHEDANCYCDEYCVSWHLLSTRVRVLNIWETALSPGVALCSEAGPIAWKLEILDGRIRYPHDHLSLLMKRAPGLKAMVRQEAGPFSLLACLPARLTLLLMDTDAGILKNPPKTRLSLSHLTSLSIASASLALLVRTWSLPSLRHLSIEVEIGHPLTSQEEVHSFLRAFNSKLHTFHYRHPLIKSEMDPRIWEVIPDVRSLQVPYKWSNGVPRGHPLCTVQISTPDILDFIAENSYYSLDPAAQYIPLIPGNGSVIRMDTTWNQELFSESYTLEIGVISLWIDDYCTSIGVPVVDANGDSFTDYVVFLITESKNNERCRSYRMDDRWLPGF